jgi:hypothetical protein
MTTTTPEAVREGDERAREEAMECSHRAAAPSYANPLPGVMDFIGASAGGELAEERWR